MKSQQRRMCEIIKRTVVNLCERGFNADNMEIRGVIGVTINDSEVLVIHINEDVAGCDDECSWQSCSVDIGSSNPDTRNPPTSPSTSLSSSFSSNIDAKEHLFFPVAEERMNNTENNYYESPPYLTTSCISIKEEESCGTNHEDNASVIMEVKVEEEDNIEVSNLHLASVAGDAVWFPTGNGDIADEQPVVKKKSLCQPQPFVSEMTSDKRAGKRSVSSNDQCINNDNKVDLANGNLTCKHCTIKLSCSSGLMAHLRTHTGEKPFKCPHCTTKFTRSSHLKSHLLTHTGEKPFKCPHCTKKFYQSSDLKRHLRTHTGEKPFKCTHCTKKFTQSSHLKSHLHTHTGE